MAPSLPSPPGRPCRRRAFPVAWTVLSIAGGLGALAQAAAGVDIRIGIFAPLAPSFHAWPKDRPQNLTGLDAASRAMLESEPLTSQPLRMLAMQDAAQGNWTTARMRMAVAERITRRDPAVQLWLVDDALRRRDVRRALRHYDIVLRTREDLAPFLLRRLASALPLDSVRTALVSYAVPGNPWFAELLTMAAKERQAGAAAALLLHLPALPDGAAWRTTYGALVTALVTEGRLALLHALHARLPGGEGSAPLSDPALGREGYAPFRWVLANGADRFAAIVPEAADSSLQVDVAPLTGGAAAARFLLPPTGAPVLAWSVDRSASGAEGEARWSILCDNGREAQSRRLVSGDGMLAAPSPCAAAQLRLLVNGGAGPERLSLRIRHLRWLRPRPIPSSPSFRENPAHAS